MPDFNDIRNSLNEAQRTSLAAKESVFLAKEKLKRIRRDQKELQRVFDPEDPSAKELKSRLERRERETSEVIKREKLNLVQSTERLENVRLEYMPFSDPRQSVGNLSDENPFLLMPVRLETRFKKVLVETREVDQLWVRVYPDDCAIDSFEAVLSEFEVKSAQKYWHGMAQAGGRESLERTAWRSLVATYGSGRARYIIELYIPENVSDLPTTATNEDFYLTIAVPSVPLEPELSAIITFWTVYWQANTDKVAQEKAIADLVATVGQTRAEEIMERWKPSNLEDQTRILEEDLEVSVVFIVFPKPEDFELKDQSWTQAPKTFVMPDRFVLTGYQNASHTNNDQDIAFQVVGNQIPSPLVVGPDPSLEEDTQIKHENGDIEVNEDMKWVVDFDDAVAKGMGFKINLSPLQASRGFNRIVALGLKLSADSDQGAEMLETLFQNHERSKKGLAILPQGTPTNNTEDEGAGHNFLDDADVSFDHLKKPQLFDIEQDWNKKKDGQWLAEWLGVRYQTFQKTFHADLTDQCEAKSMNIALFPATIGYMMETLMQPVFKEGDMEKTRWFFNHFVSGRGPVPAIKIGQQPYGILPVSTFSELGWLNERRMIRPEGIPWLKGNEEFLRDLYGTLKKMDSDLEMTFFNDVSYVGKNGDPHQLLLDIVGLNPTSVEYYQRYAESYDSLVNRFKLAGGFGKLIASIIAGFYTKTGMDLLQSFGYTGDEIPDILKKFFLKSENKLYRDLIDDRKLSETDPIRVYSEAPEEKNYIEWLIDAANTSHNSLRKQQGFQDNRIPTALLYLMLKHSLDMGYINLSLDLNLKANRISVNEYSKAKIEPSFMHVKADAKETESRWKYLYRGDEAITGSPTLMVGDYIPTVINTELKTAYLKKQLEALAHLVDTPTARLERALTEHIDLCTYRLDAWKNGFLNYELAAMRFKRDEDSGDDDDTSRTKRGTYLGAYAWLENIRPENKVLTPKTDLEDPRLIEHFAKTDEPPLMVDSTNGGFIATPSLNQAVTSAILRNAYMADDHPETFEINLSSERVRKALSLIEGVRAGQSLAALLGYYLERELHDQNATLTLVDFHIHKLRKAFPFSADKHKDTKTDDTDAIEAIEANNVVDGLALINKAKEPGNETYPFGKEKILKTSGPDAPSAAIQAAINEQVQNIMNLNDAIADIAMAESVHQVVLGNYDRAASTLNTYSRGNFPPIPDVIQTPRKGTNLTHRFGLQFEPGLDPLVSHNSMPVSPRSKAEPAINKWLAEVLPDENDTAVLVRYLDPVTTLEEEKVVTQKHLNLQPLDMLYVLDTDKDQAMTSLDDQIVNYIRNTFTPRLDAEVKIVYTEPIPSKISFFELAAQMQSLRSLILRSRSLEPMDVSIPNESKSAENDAFFLDANRISVAKNDLDAISTNLGNYIGILDPLLADTEANRAQLLADIDAHCNNLINMLATVQAYGLPQTGTGYLHEQKRVLYEAVMEKLQTIIERWDMNLTDFDAEMTHYDTLPLETAEEDLFKMLYKAERLITTVPESPQPNTPATFRLNLNPKRADFFAKLNELKAISATNHATISGLVGAVNAAIPTTIFDATALEIVDQEDQVIRLSEELKNKAAQLKQDLEKRTTAAQDLLDEASALAPGKKQVELLQEAGKHLFGRDFKMVPEFELPQKQADEWFNSFHNTAQLLNHLKTVEEVDFPLDEWRYGVARVREKMHHWEHVVSLKEAFLDSSLELHPVQLPHQPDDHWLALPYPTDHQILNDKILYTAYYSVAYSKTDRQCGLLLDEWTEVIPSKEEDVGVTFHYDRPNSEPPQVMLLAMPSKFTGEWEWNDLMNIVNETLDMAKKRALEPDQIDKTAYGRFLPATVSSVTVHPLTASLNYSYNNLIYNHLNDASS